MLKYLRTMIAFECIGWVVGCFVPFWSVAIACIIIFICWRQFRKFDSGPEGEGSMWWVYYFGSYYGLALGLGLITGQLSYFCYHFRPTILLH